MRILDLWLFIFLISYSCPAQETEELLKILDKELAREDSYVQQKYMDIKVLKEQAQRNSLKGDKRSEYRTYIELFEEYNSFKYDSAYHFLDKAKVTAWELKDSALTAEVKMKEGFILLSSGLFKEAVDSLNNIQVLALPQDKKYDYYFTKARLYYDLADYNNDYRFYNQYVLKGNEFIKKAQDQVHFNSKEYWAAEGLEQMKQQDWEAAKAAFEKLLDDFDLDPESYAVAASSLSYVYENLDEQEKSLRYLTSAAIWDIRTATKENVALRNLASEMFAQGNLEKAYTYVQQALEDATFYNARHRKMEISSILPIIEGAQLLKVEQKNESLQRTVFLLALLAMIVIVFLFIIFKQLKEKNAAKKALSAYTEKLEEMNRHLQESDAIKQDYITYFLNATSQLFSKIGHFQASTIQKIKTKQPEEVLNVVKKYNIKRERNDLFHQFDEVFLKLFPSFIEEFNALFPEDKRKSLRENELLSKELRIFALFRLGIQDSQQIAEFMNLSVATIYSYKARLKSNAIKKNSFENDLLKIKTLV